MFSSPPWSVLYKRTDHVGTTPPNCHYSLNSPQRELVLKGVQSCFFLIIIIKYSLFKSNEDRDLYLIRRLFQSNEDRDLCLIRRPIASGTLSAWAIATIYHWTEMGEHFSPHVNWQNNCVFTSQFDKGHENCAIKREYSP